MRPVLAAIGLCVPLFVASGCTVEAEPEEDVAADEGAYTASELPREVNRRIAKCFVADWSARDLELRSDARYVSEGAYRVVGAAVTRAFQGIGHLLMIGSEGEAVLRTIEGDLQEIAEAQHLDDAQRVLVTGCVTSELITYAQNGASKLLGPAAAVENYEGVCTEYSGINRRLLRAVGVDAGPQTGTVDGGGHAWNWVDVAGRTLWVEPQMNPLRRSGAYFIDPSGEAPAGPVYSTCRANGAKVGLGGARECCSGLTRDVDGASVCVAPACEARGTAVCTPSSAACTSIGGATVASSCGASVDGARCCAFGGR